MIGLIILGVLIVVIVIVGVVVWWVVKKGGALTVTDFEEGSYRIKSKSDKCLFYGIGKDLIDCEPEYNDIYYDISKVGDGYALKNISATLCIERGNSNEILYKKCDEDNNNQRFQFELVDEKLNVKHIKSGKCLAEEEDSIKFKECDNSSGSRKFTFELMEELVTTSRGMTGGTSGSGTSGGTTSGGTTSGGTTRVEQQVVEQQVVEH